MCSLQWLCPSHPSLSSPVVLLFFPCISSVQRISLKKAYLNVVPLSHLVNFVFLCNFLILSYRLYVVSNNSHQSSCQEAQQYHRPITSHHLPVGTVPCREAAGQEPQRATSRDTTAQDLPGNRLSSCCLHHSLSLSRPLALTASADQHLQSDDHREGEAS